MESLDLKIVPPSALRLRRPEGRVDLIAEITGEAPVEGVRVRRAFPMSRPDEFLSLRDKEGKEIAILEKVEGLDEESLRVLREDLDRRYFTPEIERIHSLKLEAGMWRFNVVTGRGPIEFFVRNWRDSAYEVKPNRWHIFSVDGARYEIPDVEALDPESRRWMDLLL
ncbi:DUF1854 domain-containing protein [bacterium]|nr:MAG: DUF1854 domain-containing protein [bacterium]